MEIHPRPYNLDSLIVKKRNTEIWSKLLQSKIISTDLKIQKMQGCISKTVGVISKITDTVINLKNSKNLSTNNLRNSVGPVINDCTDSLALLIHVNNSLEQSRRVFWPIVWTISIMP